MKVARVVVFLGLVAYACAQINAGQAWQGTWSNDKRPEFGGSLFVCVDLSTSTAHGAYGSGGLMSGSIQGSTWKGFWYEAGYDLPFGPFEVTITGTSFTGTWAYVNSNSTVAFSGSRSSGVEPARNQCLAPITAGNVDGTYTDAAMCYHPDVVYSNTNQQFSSAFFNTFGIVQGFSFDNGVSVSLSDFIFPDDDDTNEDRYRPESSTTCFGTGCQEVDNDDDDSVHTGRIVIGRLIDQNTFCGGFFTGWYNTFVGDICFTRTSPHQPDTFLCGSDIVYLNGHEDIFDGKTSEILAVVQEAFDNLALPEHVIEDDDGNENDDGDNDDGDNDDGDNDDGDNDEDDGSSAVDSPSGSDAGRLAASAVIVVVALALF